MSDAPAIVTDHLTKVYRLYERPQQRILDALGLAWRGNYTEHYALDDVSIIIPRGQRLGIIGRNGAGKSTLLKLVSGVTPPTSGSVRVNGQARALLEIGTGFHPEFTGRDNARAYFAQLGISGRQASHLVDEVIDFSELEEYIDQPLKTYSTGMRLRLMFSTATVVAPDILVLDEVLGVGDAYFTKKSFDRINEMARRDGATLLLVSHDIYTSARICERMIWLESGRVVFDGEPKEAVRLYEDSIRLQEEARLRAKSVQAVERDQVASPDAQVLNVELASPDGRPLEAPVWFQSVRLLAGEAELATLPVLADPPPPGALDFEGSAWGAIANWCGEHARPMKDYGSPFHRASGNLALPSDKSLPPDGLALEIVWGAESPVHLLLSCRLGQRLLSKRIVTVGGQHWEQSRFLFDPAKPDLTETVPTPRAAVFGTGRVRLDNIRTVDGSGRESFRFWHGDAFHLLFDYEVRDPGLCEKCDIVVAILRDGVETACRVLTRSLEVCYQRSPTGTIECKLDPLQLGSANYSASIMLAEHGYYEREGHPFYTVSPAVHVCIRDAIEFSVRARSTLEEGTAWVAQGKWRLVRRSPGNAGQCGTSQSGHWGEENGGC